MTDDQAEALLRDPDLERVEFGRETETERAFTLVWTTRTQATVVADRYSVACDVLAARAGRDKGSQRDK